MREQLKMFALKDFKATAKVLVAACKYYLFRYNIFFKIFHELFKSSERVVSNLEDINTLIIMARSDDDFLKVLAMMTFLKIDSQNENLAYIVPILESIIQSSSTMYTLEGGSYDKNYNGLIYNQVELSKSYPETMKMFCEELEKIVLNNTNNKILAETLAKCFMNYEDEIFPFFRHFILSRKFINKYYLPVMNKIIRAYDFTIAGNQETSKILKSILRTIREFFKSFYKESKHLQFLAFQTLIEIIGEEDEEKRDNIKEIINEALYGCDLYLMSNLPEKNKKYANSYIIVDREIFWITSDGNAYGCKCSKDTTSFLEGIKINQPNGEEPTKLSEDQRVLLEENITSNGGHVLLCEYDDIEDIKDLSKIPEEILQKILELYFNKNREDNYVQPGRNINEKLEVKNMYVKTELAPAQADDTLLNHGIKNDLQESLEELKKHKSEVDKKKVDEIFNGLKKFVHRIKIRSSTVGGLKDIIKSDQFLYLFYIIDNGTVKLVLNEPQQQLEEGKIYLYLKLKEDGSEYYYKFLSDKDKEGKNEAIEGKLSELINEQANAKQILETLSRETTNQPLDDEINNCIRKSIASKHEKFSYNLNEKWYLIGEDHDGRTVNNYIRILIKNYSEDYSLLEKVLPLLEGRTPRDLSDSDNALFLDVESTIILSLGYNSFKSLSEADDRKLNCVFGDTGVGKSTAVEAILGTGVKPPKDDLVHFEGGAIFHTKMGHGIHSKTLVPEICEGCGVRRLSVRYKERIQKWLKRNSEKTNNILLTFDNSEGKNKWYIYGQKYNQDGGKSIFIKEDNKIEENGVLYRALQDDNDKEILRSAPLCLGRNYLSNQLTHADFAGFGDNRGVLARSIASLCLQNVISRAKSVHSILLVEMLSSLKIRAPSFCSTIRTVSQLITDPIKCNGSIFFLFTHLTEKQRKRVKDKGEHDIFKIETLSEIFELLKKYKQEEVSSKNPEHLAEINLLMLILGYWFDVIIIEKFSSLPKQLINNIFVYSKKEKVGLFFDIFEGQYIEIKFKSTSESSNSKIPKKITVNSKSFQLLKKITITEKVKEAMLTIANEANAIKALKETFKKGELPTKEEKDCEIKRKIEEEILAKAEFIKERLEKCGLKNITRESLHELMFYIYIYNKNIFLFDVFDDKSKKDIIEILSSKTTGISACACDLKIMCSSVEENTKSLGDWKKSAKGGDIAFVLTKNAWEAHLKTDDENGTLHTIIDKNSPYVTHLTSASENESKSLNEIGKLLLTPSPTQFYPLQFNFLLRVIKTY